jgi:hypothetical protein
MCLFSNCAFRNILLLVSMVAILLLWGCGDPSVVSQSQVQEMSARNQVIVTRPVQTPFFQLYSTSAGSGVHVSHNAFACKTCHLTGGAVQFDPTSAAIIPGTLRTNSSGVVITNPVSGTVSKANVLNFAQLPSYNPATGTCANIACHWVKPGNFTYWDDVVEDQETVPYGTALPKTTPDWYSVAGALTCIACHGYPPYDAPNQYVWHSSWHGGVSVGSTTNPDVLGTNYCSTCHPDVITTIVNGVMVNTIKTDANGKLHGNGVVDWQFGNNSSPYWLCNQCHGG